MTAKRKSDERAAGYVEEGEAFADLAGLGAPSRAEDGPYDVIVIGAGQAGLAMGHHLARRGLRFVILEGADRVGDVWRNRWKSLRLFTPALFDGLPGMAFPAAPWSFPTKDEMGDYLEAYAERFELPVRTGARVTRLSRCGQRYLVVTAEGAELEADQVVVAMASYQQPKVPAFAKDLAEDVVQLHSSEYRSPDQLREGDVLVVGAGNSGAEIAKELAARHRVWMSGRRVGEVPWRVNGFFGRLLLTRLLLRVVFHRLLTIHTRLGRKAYPKLTRGSGPLIRTKERHLAAAGVERVGRTVGASEGRPRLDDGGVLDVANVVWCTGYHPGFSWIDVPVIGDDGKPRHLGGLVEEAPGLYFLGLHYLCAFSSGMVHGVGRDADRIAGVVAERAEGGRRVSGRAGGKARRGGGALLGLGAMLLVALLSVALAGCDGGSEEPDAAAALDGATPAGACDGAVDGTACGTAQICVAGACVESVCGDGFVDAVTREECDDGNERAFDGCEPGTCTFTCRDDAACDDQDPCNGTEVCDPASHACAGGDPLAEGSACATPVIAEGVCRPASGASRCVPPGCGNRVVDGPEACDDGRNGDDSDGCTDLCTFTCTEDADCDDDDVCNGGETCDPGSHVCVAGASLDCADGDACTMDLCDPIDGCQNPLTDVDGDGHAPTSLGACGTDCDDTRDDVNPGVEEQCDAIDHDCDGSPTSPSDPFWFPDCDGDEYGALDGLPFAVQACEEPAAMAGCAGGWTIRRPIDGDASSIDCNDADDTVHPGASEVIGDEVDQDCDGGEVCFLDDDGDGFRRPSGTPITSVDLDCTDAREARRSDPATDCCDADARAHRGQTGLFATARTGCGGFDYDCSGGITFEYPTVLSSPPCVPPDSSRPTICAPGVGWYPTRPACGVTEDYYDGCHLEGSGSTRFCAPDSPIRRRQRCR